MKHEIPDSLVAAPPASALGAYFLGIPLESWLLWLNLAYILAALGWKLWTIYKGVRDGCKRRHPRAAA